MTVRCSSRLLITCWSGSFGMGPVDSMSEAVVAVSEWKSLPSGGVGGRSVSEIESAYSKSDGW